MTLSQSLLLEEETYAVIGAAMEVHSVLGCGFLESVYQEALALEFQKRNIPIKEQEKLSVNYKGIILNGYFKIDYLCFGNIIVEIKATKKIEAVHQAQLLNYLKVSGHNIGIIFNFGAVKLEYQRLVLEK